MPESLSQPMSNDCGLMLPLSDVATVAPPVVVRTCLSVASQDEPFQRTVKMFLLVSSTANKILLPRISLNCAPWGTNLTHSGVPVKVVVPSLRVMSFTPLVGAQVDTGPQLVPSYIQ